MGAVFALGIAALMILLICLTVLGGVCLLLALLFGLICLVKARKRKKDGGKLRAVWKVLPCAFLAAGVLLLWPAFGIWRMINDPNEQLSDAVLHDDFEKAEELLDSGVDPDGKNTDGGYTLLCTLADQGLTEVRDGQGHTSWARKGGEPEKELQYERLLLEHGADVNHRVKVQRGEKELPHSSEEARDPSWKTGAKHICGKTPFLLAATRGDLDSMKLLAAYGADIHAADDCGYNAVLIAAQLLEDGSGGPEMLRWLKEQGCDVHAVNRFGQNALALIDEHQDDDQDEMRALLQS